MLLLLLLAALQARSQGQSVIAAAGEVANAVTLTLSYTVGETAVAQYCAADPLLFEGFWQRGADCAVTGIDDAGAWGDIRVFPNPTGGSFTLDLGAGFSVELHCTLFNALGSAVETATVAGGQTTVQMGDPALENGLYNLLLQTPDGRTAHTLRLLKL